MVESPVMLTEILQRPKKKNVIFEETVISRFISRFISVPAVISAFISAAKTMTKTIKPVR